MFFDWQNRRAWCVQFSVLFASRALGHTIADKANRTLYGTGADDGQAGVGNGDV